MEILDRHQVYERLAKALNKWIVIAGPLETWPNDTDWDELAAAVPWLDIDKHTQTIIDGFATAICDSEQEATGLYNAVYGDDNSNRGEVRPGVGQTRIYAILVNSCGVITNENT